VYAGLARLMLHLVRTERSYSPETVALMTAAFDRVCQSLSTRMNSNEALHQTLAQIILRHIDTGERDPVLISDAAIRELTGSERAATG
jgi:hypothetical protein